MRKPTLSIGQAIDKIRVVQEHAVEYCQSYVNGRFLIKRGAEAKNEIFIGLVVFSDELSSFGLVFCTAQPEMIGLSSGLVFRQFGDDPAQYAKSLVSRRNGDASIICFPRPIRRIDSKVAFTGSAACDRA